MTIDFFLMFALEWLMRGRRSFWTESASDGVIMCGSVMIGSDISGIAVPDKS